MAKGREKSVLNHKDWYSQAQEQKLDLTHKMQGDLTEIQKYGFNLLKDSSDIQARLISAVEG